jgi:TolB-like protein/Tfp pilus assembly protein PilF
MSFFAELKRRSVYRVAVLYIIVSWLVLQVADVFMSFLPLPEWTPNLIFVLLVLGFPVALVLAWAFELTPEGLRRESAAIARRQPASGFRRIDILIVAGLLMAAGYAIFSRDSERAPPASQTDVAVAEAGPIDSIVVLPLKDLTNDPGQAYFVAGMHEALITELSKVEALRVISRTSAMVYEGSDKPLPEIARELDVDAVVEGSVLRAGDTVRVTAQLIEAGSDRHLWADNYDRELTDILALYGEVAKAIVDEIRVNVTPEEALRLANARTVDPDIYVRYLQGRYLCDNWSPQEMWQGAGLLREAVRLDPHSALAHAELALCLQYLAFFNYAKPTEIYEESLAIAKRALSLDEQLAEAHVAMAGITYYLKFDTTAAEQQLRRALELNPGSVKALIHLSWLLGESGRFAEGLPVTRKAIDYDPYNTVARHALGQLYMLDRQHERSVEAYAQALELDPRDPFLQSSMALALLQTGQAERAAAFADAALSLSGRAPLYISALVYHHAQAGQTQAARKLLEELLQNEDTAPYDLAFAYLGLGELEVAIDYLEQAHEQRNSQIVYLSHAHFFDPLRGHPRFQALLERTGL